MILQSATLTQSQWLSKWNNELSAKAGRLLILSIIFSRRAINLKAGVFYVLSMETFTAVSTSQKCNDDLSYLQTGSISRDTSGTRGEKVSGEIAIIKRN